MGASRPGRVTTQVFCTFTAHQHGKQKYHCIIFFFLKLERDLNIVYFFGSRSGWYREKPRGLLEDLPGRESLHWSVALILAMKTHKGCWKPTGEVLFSLHLHNCAGKSQVERPEAYIQRARLPVIERDMCSNTYDLQINTFEDEVDKKKERPSFSFISCMKKQAAANKSEFSY